MKYFIVFLLALASCMPSDLMELQVIPEEKAMDFIKGFVEGIGETGNFEELKKCINGAEGAINKIIEAIKLIKKGGFENIIAGIAKLVEAVKELLDILKPCAGSMKELQRLIEALKHIDIKKIALKILTNFAKFISLITEAIACFEKGDFYCAGKDIGIFLRMLFLDATEEFNYDDFSFDDIIKILKGLLKGIDQKGVLENTMACINSMPYIYKLLMDLVEEIKNMQWKNIEEFAKAMVHVMEVLKTVLQSAVPCSKCLAELYTIMLKIMSITWAKIMEHAMKNIGSLLSDLTKAVGHIQKAMYFEFGEDVGDIIWVLFLSE